VCRCLAPSDFSLLFSYLDFRRDRRAFARGGSSEPPGPPNHFSGGAGRHATTIEQRCRPRHYRLNCFEARRAAGHAADGCVPCGAADGHLGRAPTSIERGNRNQGMRAAFGVGISSAFQRVERFRSRSAPRAAATARGPGSAQSSRHVAPFTCLSWCAIPGALSK
jgi:hypothetical protein